MSRMTKRGDAWEVGIVAKNSWRVSCGRNKTYNGTVGDSERGKSVMEVTLLEFWCERGVINLGFLGLKERDWKMKNGGIKLEKEDLGYF